MATCDFCGTVIVFGGVKDSGRRFCNKKCHEQGFLVLAADRIPEEVLSREVADLRQGNCPNCGGPGPIDVHTSHTVWSMLVMTSWQSHPRVSCRACGVKAKLGAVVFSSVLGWWGLPWGVIATPIQIVRNLIGLFSSPNPAASSEELEEMTRLHLAAQLIDAEPEEPSSELRTELIISDEQARAGGVQSVTFQRHNLCPSCSGRADGQCQQCAGLGTFSEEKTLKLRVPPQARDGLVLRLAGQGHQEEAGGERGDLYVDVRVRGHSDDLVNP